MRGVKMSYGSQVERLEGRRLLSAAAVWGGVMQPVTVASHPGVVQGSARPAAGVVARGPAQAQSTDLVGNWAGNVKVKYFFYSRKFDGKMAITGQTDTGITGTITIGGHTMTGTLNGKIGPLGKFTYSLTQGKDSVTVSGRLNPAGTAMAGNVSGKYDGWKAKGDFSFKKVV